MRLLHEFTLVQSTLLGLFTAFVIKSCNRGSFIIRYEDKNILLDKSRVLIECTLLLFDEYYDCNYGLWLVFFGRFIDLFLTMREVYPYVVKFTPIVIAAIDQFTEKREPVNMEKKRKPAFAD